MGVETNGQICYGIFFEEGTEFPWGEDLEEWWVCAKIAELKYTGGRPPRVSYNSILEMHPIPVREVNYAHQDCYSIILATPSSFKRAYRGYPITFTPEELKVTDKEALISFCKKYIPEYTGEQPEWYLSSYYG